MYIENLSNNRVLRSSKNKAVPKVSRYNVLLKTMDIVLSSHHITIRIKSPFDNVKKKIRKLKKRYLKYYK